MDWPESFFRSKKREYLLVILLFIFITIAFTWPLVLHLHNGVIGGEYDPLLNSWIISWDAQTIFSQPTNLFQGNIYYPSRDVLAYSEHLFTMGVLAAPVYYATHNPILAYNLLILFAFVFSAFGCYLLVKELTGSRWGGLIAGVFFAFCPFKMSALPHIHVLFSPFLPFVLLYLYRYLRKGRKWDLVWFGLLFLAQSLASWHYLAYCVIAVGLLWIWFAASSRKKENWLRLALVVMALILVAAVIVPFALPYFRVRHRLPDFGRSLEDLQSNSATPAKYVTVLPQHVIYGKSPPPPLIQGSLLIESVLFPGLLIVLLALAGAFMRRRQDDTALAFKPASFRRGYLYFLVLCVVGVILTFGAEIGGVSNPLYMLFYHLGLFKFIRVPSRLYVLVALGLSVMAGYGMAKISIRYSQWRNSLQAGRILSIAFVLLLLVELATFNFGVSPVPVHADVPDVYNWIKKQGDVRVIDLPTEFNNLPLQSMAIYFSTYHWKKTSNGYSGYSPYFARRIFNEMEGFPSKRSIDLLKGLRINYIIWHWDWVNEPRKQQYRDRFLSLPGLELEGEFDDVTVLGIKDGDLASPHQLNVSVLAAEKVPEGGSLNASLVVDNPTELPFLIVEECPQSYQIRFLDTQGEVAAVAMGEYQAPFFLEKDEATTLELPAIDTPSQGAYTMELTLLGGVLGERTLFSEVKVVPPGSLIGNGIPDGKVVFKNLGETEEVIPPSGLHPINLELENSGSLFWKSSIPDPDSQQEPEDEASLFRPVYLDIQWELDGEILAETMAIELPCDISPGQTIRTPILLETPYNAGRYRLLIGLHEEGGGWFGSPAVAEIPVGSSSYLPTPP